MKSFSPGSSAGLDGLRHSRLKDLIGFTYIGGRKFVAALASLVNLVLLGEVPPATRLYIPKTCHEGCAASAELRTRREVTARQLGFGTAGGCEAAVHATHQFVNHMGDEEVVVKIDMHHNAFNSIRRDHFLATIREDAPLGCPKKTFFRLCKLIN